MRQSFLLAAGFAALYLATATHTVQGGDTAEFVTVAAQGGVAHPPGYPLFILLASLFAKVAPGPLPFRVTAATVFCAVGSLWVLHRVVARWTGDAAAAAIGASALGASFLFWHWSTVAEVLPGGALTTALVVAAALGSARGARGAKQGLLVGLAAATGIANHHTVVLLLPLCVFGWVAAIPRPLSGRGVLLTTGAATAGVAVGFLPYLALMSADGPWMWGDTTSFGGLVHHFLRSDYGSFSIPNAGATPWWTHPWLYLRTLTSEFFGVLWLLIPIGAAVGLGAGRRTGSGPADRRDLREPGLTLALLGSWLLAAPWLLSQFTYPTEGFFVAVVERFHLQPNVLLAVLLGVGAAWVRRLPLWSRPTLPAVILAVNVAAVGLMNAPRAGWSSNTVLEDFLHNALDEAEERAVLITSGDAQTFGFVYAQEVLGLRPDVAAVAPGLLPHAWYRERLTRRHPDLVLVDAEGRGLPWMGVVALNPGRPIHVSPRLAARDAEIAPPMVPWGPFMRVVRDGESLPPPHVVEAQLGARMATFRMGSRIVDAEECRHTLECTTWDHYALVLDAVATGYRAAGQEADAQRVHAAAVELSPWLWE
ncbi:MAG: DUF2723 domain-containing protein [Deltaproteobacteria bacterium]|nr:DUF2723 domain-containing protein [Deltaproteobacteria bacterium]